MKRLSTLVVALAFLAVACGSSGDATEAGSGSAPIEISGAAIVGSGTVDFASYAGTDTIAWFWAPW